MKNLELPLQVVNMTWFYKIQMKDLTLTMNLPRCTVEHCSSYSDARGITTLPPNRISSQDLEREKVQKG
jgi:hypothetical protein